MHLSQRGCTLCTAIQTTNALQKTETEHMELIPRSACSQEG